MSEQPDLAPVRVIDVDLDELVFAFESSMDEATSYLDLQTGQVVTVGDEHRRLAERIGEGLDVDDWNDEGAVARAFAEALEAEGLPDWQREEVEQADLVESGLGTRFLEIEADETRDAYRDMEAFVETVSDARLRERLDDAIDGRGAFRRFGDLIDRQGSERERWFTFKRERVLERALRWLRDEGIEPRNTRLRRHAG